MIYRMGCYVNTIKTVVHKDLPSNDFFKDSTTSHNCCFRLNGLYILKSAMSQSPVL